MEETDTQQLLISNPGNAGRTTTERYSTCFISETARISTILFYGLLNSLKSQKLARVVSKGSFLCDSKSADSASNLP